MDGASLTLLVLSSVIWIAPLGVQASNFGSIIFGTEPVESGAWLANNRTHKVDLHNTTTEIGAAVQWAMANALEPTVMTAVLVDDEIYDVQIRDGNWDNSSWRGLPVLPQLWPPVRIQTESAADRSSASTSGT